MKTTTDVEQELKSVRREIQELKFKEAFLSENLSMLQACNKEIFLEKLKEAQNYAFGCSILTNKHLFNIVNCEMGHIGIKVTMHRIIISGDAIGSRTEEMNFTFLNARNVSLLNEVTESTLILDVVALLIQKTIGGVDCYNFPKTTFDKMWKSLSEAKRFYLEEIE